MAKILIVGDLHCKKTSLDVVGEVLDKCRKIATKCDLTVFLGDVNNDKANIRSETIRLLTNKLKSWPTCLDILTGNHDMDNAMYPEGGHSLEFLETLSSHNPEYVGIKVIKSPEIMRDFIGGRLFIPYYPEERFLKEFNKIREQKADFVFLHQDMNFCKYSNGTPVRSGISAGMFSQYKRVFVGHIHLPQEFKNIVYVGTPYTESFKESDEDKRVVVYDTDTDKILSIPLGARQHVTFEYTISSIEELKDIKQDLKKRIQPHHVVRVKINVPEEIEHKVKKSLFKGINVSSLKTNKIATTKRVVMVTENMSNIETMEMYLKQLELENKVLEPVLEINKTILGGI